MRRAILALAWSIVVLGLLWSGIHGRTFSAYLDTDATAANAFTAAPDWTAPNVSSAVIGRTTGYDTGSIKKGGAYYVYASVADTGNPSSSIGAVTTNVSAITSGQTTAPLTSGTYNRGGVNYNYRSASLTAGGSLAAGSYNFTITATDGAANSGTQTFSATVDNTAPAASDVQSTNGGGGTVGHLNQGDTLTLTYSQTIDPYSILSAWDGSVTNGVLVKLIDGGSSNDYIQFWTTGGASTQVPLGTVYLGSKNYLTTGSGQSVTFGATGAATPTTMVRNGAAITLTLGTASAATATNGTAAAMTWTPSATALDVAGNACTTTTATQTGGVHVNF
jgi:hypothetical protein